ncbi:RNA polymerase sigma-70 factor [Chitinophaga caseinilytica]|uniref:RNA polymerase sigma-70 factor n=1 Tax=Chitinophaga caseinilytica TaxID=2267521 RepID=A0ABZ2Z221_9BACT
MTDTAALFRKMTAENDQLAFRQFYDHFFVTLFRFTCSLLKEREVAEEITHDVFVQCWQKRHELGDVRNPQVYLFVAARNKVVDHARRQSQLRSLPLQESDEEQLQFSPDPEQLLITSEMMGKMEEAIRELPPKCREIFILVKQYGLRYKEVAAILELSTKTVENQLAIALKKLTTAVTFRLEMKVMKKI